MRMRGVPSVCIAAKRVCGARAANIRLYRIVFRYAYEKVEAPFDNFNGESIFMRRAHTPTIATDGRYRFSKLAFCFDAS